MLNPNIFQKNTDGGAVPVAQNVLERTLVPLRAIKTVHCGKVSKNVKYSQIVITPFWEKN